MISALGEGGFGSGVKLVSMGQIFYCKGEVMWGEEELVRDLEGDGVGVGVGVGEGVGKFLRYFMVVQAGGGGRGKGKGLRFPVEYGMGEMRQFLGWWEEVRGVFLVLLEYVEWCDGVRGGRGELGQEIVESSCEGFGQGELRILKMG